MARAPRGPIVAGGRGLCYEPGDGGVNPDAAGGQAQARMLARGPVHSTGSRAMPIEDQAGAFKRGFAASRRSNSQDAQTAKMRKQPRHENSTVDGRAGNAEYAAFSL
jgi:hypothetical protein